MSLSPSVASMSHRKDVSLILPVDVSLSYWTVLTGQD